MLRLTLIDDRGCIVFRRYTHEQRGVVETLTCGNVTYIRPGFGGATQATGSRVKSKRRRRARGSAA
jgi:hypothetical protein